MFFTRFFYELIFSMIIIVLAGVIGVKAFRHYVTRSYDVVVIVGDEAIFRGKLNCVDIDPYPVPSVLKKVTLHDNFLCLHEYGSYTNNIIEVVPVGKFAEE